MKNKQQGMTLIGWIGVIVIILVLALAAIRLVPVYLQYFRVADVIRDVPLQMQNENNGVTPQKIRLYIDKRFDVEAITVITSKDVKIERKSESFIVTADYSHEVPYMVNVNFLVDFVTSSEVRR
ncbi:MAG: DUF4845 domain-containing protein [Pseudomonadota bacterium]